MPSGTVHDPTKIINVEELDLAESSRIDTFCLFNATGGAEIRGESVIHAGSHVVGTGPFEMGPRSVVTYNCVLLTSTADLRYPASSVVPIEQRNDQTAPICLERETFVGAGAVVMPGVTLAEGAVVAAQSYVDEDVPPWTIRYPDGATRPREPASDGRFDI